MASTRTHASESNELMTQEQAEAIAAARGEVQQEWAKLAKVVGMERAHGDH